MWIIIVEADGETFSALFALYFAPRKKHFVNFFVTLGRGSACNCLREREREREKTQARVPLIRNALGNDRLNVGANHRTFRRHRRNFGAKIQIFTVAAEVFQTALCVATSRWTNLNFDREL